MPFGLTQKSDHKRRTQASKKAWMKINFMLEKVKRENFCSLSLKFIILKVDDYDYKTRMKEGIWSVVAVVFWAERAFERAREVYDSWEGGKLTFISVSGAYQQSSSFNSQRQISIINFLCWFFVYLKLWLEKFLWESLGMKFNTSVLIWKFLCELHEFLDFEGKMG